MELADVLAKMDDRLQKQDQILAQQNEMLRVMYATLTKVDDNSEKIAQYTARNSQMLAEHTLLFDRAMHTLDRIERRLDEREGTR
jgi:ABC-type transporter Mla subunit MlaD